MSVQQSAVSNQFQDKVDEVAFSLEEDVKAFQDKFRVFRS